MNAELITDCHSLAMTCGFYLIHLRTNGVFEAEVVGHCEDRHRDWPLFEMTEYEFPLRTKTRDMFFAVWNSWDDYMIGLSVAEPDVYHNDDIVYFDYLYFGM